MGYEIDFLQVGDGNGDAICLRYGGGIMGQTIHVVDGGFTDTGKKLVKHINDWYSPQGYIDHVVLTHGDNDHACGLIEVLMNFQVGTLWMNRPWKYAEHTIGNFHGNYTVQGLIKEIRDGHPYLVELEKIALQKSIPIREAFQGTQIGAFTVLSPSLASYMTLMPNFDKTPMSYTSATSLLGGLFTEMKKAVQKYSEDWGVETLPNNPDATSASNESSIVQIGRFDNDLVLLTADAGPLGLENGFRYAQQTNLGGRLNIFQIPHHGSRRNVTPNVLDMWLGQKIASGTPNVGHAICSLGKEKDAYPRNRVKNAILRRGYGVYTTRTGNVRHGRDIGERPGYSAMQSLPFTRDFEE